VVDEQGDPVAQAVILPGEDRICTGMKPAFRTDAAGYFSIPHSPKPRASLTVKAKGHCAGAPGVFGDGRHGPAADFAGTWTNNRARVVNATGAPLAGTHVSPKPGGGTEPWNGTRKPMKREGSHGQAPRQMKCCSIFWQGLQAGAQGATHRVGGGADGGVAQAVSDPRDGDGCRKRHTHRNLPRLAGVDPGNSPHLLGAK